MIIAGAYLLTIVNKNMVIFIYLFLKIAFLKWKYKFKKAMLKGHRDMNMFGSLGYTEFDQVANKVHI